MYIVHVYIYMYSLSHRSTLLLQLYTHYPLIVNNHFLLKRNAIIIICVLDLCTMSAMRHLKHA